MTLTRLAAALLGMFAMVARNPAASAQSITDVHLVSVAAARLIYDPVHHVILAAVGPNGGGTLTNSITIIDPASGAIVKSAFVGDSPASMALSSDCRYLYVVVAGGQAVQRVDDIVNLKMGPLYPMPTRHVVSVWTLPENPNGFIACVHNPEPYVEHLVTFIDGKPIGREAQCAEQVTPGISDARLFSFSPYSFRGAVVDKDGIDGIKPGNLTDHSDQVAGTVNGLVMIRTGNTVDPEVIQSTGSFDFNAAFQSLHPQYGFGDDSPCVFPDSSTGRAYILRGSGRNMPGQCMVIGDPRTFQTSPPLMITDGARSGVQSAIRVGEDGFACILNDKSTLLFRLVGEPPNPKVDVAVARSGLPATIPDDGAFKYRLTITNKGPIAAHNLVLSDILPNDTEVTSVSSTQGNITEAAGIVRGQIPSLEKGAIVTADVSVRIGPRHTGDGDFVAVVRTSEPDSHPEDNLQRSKIGKRASDITPTPAAPLKTALLGQWDSLTEDISGAGINLQVAIVGHFTIRNNGKSALTPFHVRFYLGADNRFDKGAAILLQQISVPALEPGATFTAGLNAPLQTGDDDSGLYVFAVMDPEKSLGDAASDTANGRLIP